MKTHPPHCSEKGDQTLLQEHPSPMPRIHQSSTSVAFCFFLQIVNCAHTAIYSCLYICINMDVKREMLHTHNPLKPPLSSHQHPQSWLCDAGPVLSQRGLTRASSSGPSCYSTPWWMPLSWAAERGHQALSLWGKLRTLISAVIGGNWKLSVPLGCTGGPVLLSCWAPNCWSWWWCSITLVGSRLLNTI